MVYVTYQRSTICVLFSGFFLLSGVIRIGGGVLHLLVRA